MNTNTTNKISFLERMIVVGVIFFTLFFVIGYVTNPYNEKADRVIRGLYSKEKIFDEIDVALIGGSHGCNGFNPIW